jgi:hypothetical protein
MQVENRTTDQRVETALDLMTAFAARTGLVENEPNRRYLWTDAFAVCNFLCLWQTTGDHRHRELAVRLIALVHETLGRHRSDDVRKGWLSGLTDEEAHAHPTRGGLRIGKPSPERHPEEPYDSEREWDRDGQYFHYLTKWMHALDVAARRLGAPHYNLWARELADTALRAFYHPPGLFWKMSIDLSRPLVPSMGQHDPLDGYVTFSELMATMLELGSVRGPDLEGALATMGDMLSGIDILTDDPLGIGGLFFDARRLEARVKDGDLKNRVTSGALAGLQHYMARAEWRRPSARRLAFRELGLSIGVRAIAHRFPDLMPLADSIETFWLDPTQRTTRTFLVHQDINEVMLATSLLPDALFG